MAHERDYSNYPHRCGPIVETKKAYLDENGLLQHKYPTSIDIELFAKCMNKVGVLPAHRKQLKEMIDVSKRQLKVVNEK